VAFVLDSWRALPTAAALALTHQHAVLNDAVDTLASWLEHHGGAATPRAIKIAHVAGVRTTGDLNLLLKRYAETYPGTIKVTESGAQGGRPGRLVQAPRRARFVALATNLPHTPRKVASPPPPDTFAPPGGVAGDGQPAPAGGLQPDGVATNRGYKPLATNSPAGRPPGDAPAELAVGGGVGGVAPTGHKPRGETPLLPVGLAAGTNGHVSPDTAAAVPVGDEEDGEAQEGTVWTFPT
jgi:hypothetical protein